MKTDYEKQANDFLKKTGSILTVNFLKHGKHFPSDKEERDIYTCELKRGSRSFIFPFGASLNDSGFYFTMGKRKTDIDRKYLQPEHSKNLIHHVKSISGYAFLNNGKSDVIHYPKTPNAYDILTCLTKYDPGSFADFCSEYGYDEDSRTAERTYRAVVKEYTKLCTLYSNAEMEEMAEIQ